MTDERGAAMTREDGGRLYDADHLATQITEARAALAAVPPPVPAVSANPYASLYYPLLFLVTVAERFPRSLGEWLDREPEPTPLSAAMMKRLRDSRELHRALERRGMDPAEVLPALAAAEAEREALNGKAVLTLGDLDLVGDYVCRAADLWGSNDAHASAALGILNDARDAAIARLGGAR